MTFPQCLRALASRATREAAAPSASAHEAGLLRALAHRADELAAALIWLDHGAREEVLGRLPLTSDYHTSFAAEAARLTERLGAAVEGALAAAEPGPRPFPELTETVRQLSEIFERGGGRFTHTPREKLEYTASPQSPAGRFVVAFFSQCDPDLPEHRIASAMARWSTSAPSGLSARVELSDRPPPSHCFNEIRPYHPWRRPCLAWCTRHNERRTRAEKWWLPGSQESELGCRAPWRARKRETTSTN